MNETKAKSIITLLVGILIGQLVGLSAARCETRSDMSRLKVTTAVAHTLSINSYRHKGIKPTAGQVNSLTDEFVGMFCESSLFGCAGRATLTEIHSANRCVKAINVSKSQLFSKNVQKACYPFFSNSNNEG